MLKFRKIFFNEMDLFIYKIDEKPEFIKNASLEANDDHEEDLQLIIQNFPNFNQMPLFDTILFSKTLVNFMKLGNKDDFDALFCSDFHKQLLTYITIESKPNVFITCIDALNKILKNIEAEKISQHFMTSQFAHFIFMKSTYNYLEKTITQINTNKMCLNLLKVLLNLFKNDITLFQSFQPSLFFQKICQLYHNNASRSTSIKALEILIYILSQDKIILKFDEIEPAFLIVQTYISNLINITNEDINYTLNSIELKENFQDRIVNFDEFSKICQLIIQIAKRNSDTFFLSFNINNFFQLLLYSNQICACSHIDVLIFILSLPVVPVEFVNSIIWANIHFLMKKFNAHNSSNSDFIIKICQLIESLMPFKKIESSILEDLIFFIDNGSFKMREYALSTICKLFLDDSFHLLSLDFKTHLSKSVLFAIFSFLEYSDDSNFLDLLLSTLIKTIDYFQKSKDIDSIAPIQEFCSSENFRIIFERPNTEKISHFEETILTMLEKIE